MSNQILFTIGLVVCFIFLGGMIIHTIVSQRIKEDKILNKKQKANEDSNPVTVGDFNRHEDADVSISSR